MTVFNTSTFDTTPGATGELAVLAPPSDVTTHEEYLQWLRQARNDPMLNQVMACAARTIAGKSSLFRSPEITGPLAETLSLALKGMAKWMYGKKKGEGQKDGPPAYSMREAFEQPVSSEPPLDLFANQASL